MVSSEYLNQEFELLKNFSIQLALLKKTSLSQNGDSSKQYYPVIKGVSRLNSTRSDCEESDRISSADSGASSKARLTPSSTNPPPTPPKRGDSVKKNKGTALKFLNLNFLIKRPMLIFVNLVKLTI